MLAKDIRAAYEGDHAAKGYDEVIFSYPGSWAIWFIVSPISFTTVMFL